MSNEGHLGRGLSPATTIGAMTVGDLITIDGEFWRVVSLAPLVMRRCRDGRVGIEINRRTNGKA